MTIADALRHLSLSTPDPRSDGELVSAFVEAQEEAAFAELLHRHGPTVYGVCIRVIGNAPDADDAFQAVFLVLARKARTIRPPGMVGNWLYGVAVRTANKARVMNAKQVNRRCEPPGGLDQHPVVHTGGSPDRETLAVIDTELAALPDVYRTAFVTCELNGRTRSEASRELGWPEGTVAARLAKARDLLAARLRKRGVTLGVSLFAAAAVPTATATETLVAVRELLAVGTANAVTPAAQHLSDEVAKSMTTIHAKWLVAVGVLTLTLATSGAVLLAGGPDKTPVRELIKAPVPKVAEAVWKEETPIEFKDNGRVTSIAFAASGKTFAVCRANGRIDFYDPATRKHQQSMNFLGDPKANPKREGGSSPAIAFRPRPHAKLGDVFAITHKNGVNFGTTNIGLLVDEPKAAVDDVPTNWVVKGFDPHQVMWPGDESVVATDGAKLEWRNRLTGQNDKLDYNWELAGGTRGHPTVFAALPEQNRLFVTNASVFKDTNMIQVAKTPLIGGPADQQLSGHNARPVAGAVTADGDRIVSADGKGTLIVWERKDAKFEEKHRVELGEGVAQLALAPDGKTVAVLRAFVDTELLGRSKRVLTTLHLYVFDVTLPPETPKPLWTTEKSPLVGREKSTGPFSLAFSSEGKTLLAAFGDPEPGVDRGLDGADPEAKSLGVRVWTLGGEKIKAPAPKPIEAEWKEGKPIELENDKRITGVAYSPDGKKIAIGQDHFLTLIEADIRKSLWTSNVIGPTTRVAFSPDGEAVMTTFDGGVMLYATKNGQTGLSFEEKGFTPTAVAYAPHTTILAPATKPLRAHKVLFGHPGRLIEKTWVDGGAPSTTNIELAPKGVAPDGATALPLAPAPTGDRIVTLGAIDRKTGRNILWAWAAGSKADSKVLEGHKGRPTAAAWAADNSRIVTVDDHGTVIVWDTEEFKEKSRVELGVGVAQLALAPDGKTVAVLRAVKSRLESELDQTDFELFVFDLTDPPAKPKPLWKTEKPFSWGFAGPASLAFSPDGKTLLAAFADPNYDVTSGGKTQKSSGVRVWELVPKK